eukprot:11100385-Alexandrium_andersonii.AAC.1
MSGRPQAAPRFLVGPGARLGANAPKRYGLGRPCGAPPVARMCPSGAGAPGRRAPLCPHGASVEIRCGATAGGTAGRGQTWAFNA